MQIFTHVNLVSFALILPQLGCSYLSLAQTLAFAVYHSCSATQKKKSLGSILLAFLYRALRTMSNQVSCDLDVVLIENRLFTG